MFINCNTFSKTSLCGIALIGMLFSLQNKAYAQNSPIETIQKIYSFYEPKSKNDSNDIGLDRMSSQSYQFFSPDFYNVIKEDDKLTSSQGDASIIDYDFICNCQDTMDGLIVRSIQTLHQTPTTARIKVSFDFIINGTENISRDDQFTYDHPGQQHTYFDLIKLQNHWFIDDITDANNVGVKNKWKKELRQYYNSSIH